MARQSSGPVGDWSQHWDTSPHGIVEKTFRWLAIPQPKQYGVSPGREVRPLVPDETRGHSWKEVIMNAIQHAGNFGWWPSHTA